MGQVLRVDRPRIQPRPFRAKHSRGGQEVVVRPQTQDDHRLRGHELDETILFHPLSSDEIGDIVTLQIADLNGRLEQKNIRLELTTAASRLIAERGYEPAYGARPLKRVIQKLIENPLAQALLSGDFVEGDVVRGDVDAAQASLVFRRSSRNVAESVEAEVES